MEFRIGGIGVMRGKWNVLIFFKNFENLEKIYLFFFLFLNYEMHKWKDIELVQGKDWNLV